MTAKTSFKCLHCNEQHLAEPRNRGRQQYCSKPECRKASKAAAQRRWLEREENRDYFRGAGHCERVRRWRAANPGYWRRRRVIAKDALQDPLKSQHVANESIETSSAKDALQDLWLPQPALVVGLISVLTGNTLQDDIAASARGFINRGEDILRMTRGDPPAPATPFHHERQAHPLPATSAARASPVQLDRPANRA